MNQQHYFFNMILLTLTPSLSKFLGSLEQTFLTSSPRLVGRTSHNFLNVILSSGISSQHFLKKHLFFSFFCWLTQTDYYRIISARWWLISLVFNEEANSPLATICNKVFNSSLLKGEVPVMRRNISVPKANTSPGLDLIGWNNSSGSSESSLATSGGQYARLGDVGEKSNNETLILFSRKILWAESLPWRMFLAWR